MHSAGSSEQAFQGSRVAGPDVLPGSCEMVLCITQDTTSSSSEDDSVSPPPLEVHGLQVVRCGSCGCDSR